MDAIRDKACPFEMSPTRNELEKPEHGLNEAEKSADFSSESSADDRLDHEESLPRQFRYRT